MELNTLEQGEGTHSLKSKEMELEKVRRRQWNSDPEKKCTEPGILGQGDGV